MDFITDISGYEYKKKGCMDINALNYDIDAEAPMNNCVYPPKEINRDEGGSIELEGKL